jgi:hypothetical protein
MSEISTRAAIVVALALLALVLAGLRKPARPWRHAPRGGRMAAWAVTNRGQHVLVPVEHRDVEIYHRTPWWRRLLAAGGLGVISTVGGLLAALAVALGLSWTVTTLTDLLRS